MTSPPLTGIRVLDLTQMMAGPFCTMLLADMGADVVKIEKPDGGDDTRRAGPPFIGDDSAAFLGINRNKRGMVVDLKSEGGASVLRRMMADADVLVQNMRPGAMNRMGLGYDDVRALYPSLIYCSISGYGSTGPYKDKPGFDLMAQGASGVMSITGYPGGPPVRIGVPIADLNAGMFAANGVLAAYISRLKTGRGQHVDVSLLESSIAYTIWESSIYFATGRAPGPVGTGSPILAPYQAFATSDGHIVVGGANQANWQRLCRAIGREELLDDSRFTTNVERMANLESLAGTIQETLELRSSGHWLGVLEKAGVPCGPINNLADVYADPHVASRDMLVELQHPVAGAIGNIGVPTKLSETPGAVRTPAPTLGQHTDEVLAEHGYSPGEVAGFREAGVVA